ncbi:MAG TPA: PEGA domain-containing protein [Kofleriaceae bacterium]|nr:PEGA domain-containing protein [Kofleriaceae bacterium]
MPRPCGGGGGLGAALVSAILLAAVPVRADGIGVIAAGDRAAGAGADRAAVAAVVVEAIGARGRVVGDAIGEARAQQAAGAVPSATLARFRRVREMIDDGWRAYLRVQIDFAQSRLAAARIEAEPLVALPGGAELYADAALRLGAVLQHRRIADAPAVIALALALDPARPITLAEFSPDVVDAVAAVRAAPAALQRVHVTAVPQGASVSIDGRELGAAPLDVQVTRGQHLVTVRAPTYRAVVQGVNVDAAATVDLRLEPDDDEARLAGGAAPGLAAPLEQALVDTTLVFAELDEVVIAAVGDRRGGPVLTLQRCGGAPARCTAVTEIGFGDRAGLAAAARDAWQTVQAGALTEAPGVLGAIRPSHAPDARCRLCRNPYVWTGVGAVVLGAAIAIIATSGSKPAPILTVNGKDFGH